MDHGLDMLRDAEVTVADVGVKLSEHGGVAFTFARLASFGSFDNYAGAHTLCRRPRHF